MSEEFHNKKTFLRFTFLFISVIILIIGVIGIRNLLIKPDLPFSCTFNGTLIIDSGTLASEEILSIDNHPVSSIFQLEFYLDSRSVGDVVLLNVASLEGSKIISAALVPYYKNNLFVIVSMIVGIFFWLTSLFVIIKKPEDRAARILFWIIISFALATVTSPGKYQVDELFGILVRIAHALSYMIGITTFLHFSFIFPQARQRLKRILPLIYIPSVIICVLLSVALVQSIRTFDINWIKMYDKMWDVLQAALVVAVFVSIYNFLHSYILFDKDSDRKKIQWIIWGLFIGVLPFILLFVIPNIFGKTELISEGYLIALLIVIPVTFTIAVLKYRIFDIEVIINRSIVYSLLTLTVILIYSFVILIVYSFSKGITGQNDYILSLVMILIIAFIFNPLRQKIQHFVDRTFYREKYDFERDLGIFSNKLKISNTAVELGNAIINEIDRLIHVKSLAIVLIAESRQRLRILSQNNFDELAKNISAFRVNMIKADYSLPLGLKEKIDSEIEIDESMMPVFKRWDINLAVPLSAQSGKQIGAIVLGDKQSGLKYTVKDMNLIKIICTQSAIAIQRLLLQEQLIQEEFEKKELEELNSLKSYFVSSVSHDLQTPLTSIQMFSETLLSGKIRSTVKRHEYLNIIKGESERLRRLINNVLDYSKIERGIKQYNFDKINLTVKLRFILDSMKFIFDKDNFKIKKCIPKKSIFILADGDAVEEVVINLITNAIKFSGSSRVIDIALEEQESNVCIRVTDYGIGISKESISLIFEKYFQLEQETHQRTPGTGLGLTIVSHIMKAHEGSVLVESEIGKGSTFSLLFPKFNIKSHAESINN